jgi:hypothetical protein
MPGKTPKELIDQLDRISKTTRSAGLLIAFPAKSICVPSTDPNRLEVLTLAVRNGGTPLAWFGLFAKDATTPEYILLPELRDQEWAKHALEHILASQSAMKPSGPNRIN